MSSQNSHLPSVPEGEIVIDFARSSGPGGQKVNKTSSKAVLRWKVGDSSAFSDHQKDLIRQAAGKRLNVEDEIVLQAETERSQFRNRDAAVERLQQLVARALTPKKPRKATKVSKSKLAKRREDNVRHSQKKANRKPPRGGW